jgi:CRP/FNR family cyclic AMP-dependent transcriptional regulator
MIPMPDSLKEILKDSRVKHFPRGQIIIFEGDKPIDVYLIKSGVIKLHDIDSKGNEKILHLLKEPSLAPLAFYSGEDSVAMWFYTALTDCELYVLDRKELGRTMEQRSEISKYFMQQYSNDVHEVFVRLSSLGKSDANYKIKVVLRFLLVCHGVKRRSGWWRIPFAVNHQLLSDMAGITRESTAIVMKNLEVKGFIRNPRQTILELNREKLIRVK